MPPSSAQLRRDALDIWHAGLAAVDSERLVAAALRVEGKELLVGPLRPPLDTVGRIFVVGAGKAGAGMAAAVETALGPADGAATARRLGQRAGRLRAAAATDHALPAPAPAGCNEPAPEGVAATEAILRQVAALETNDLCLVLISGGGSALLPAPEGVTLEDKLALTRHLSAAGANIDELNTVRKQLSRIKGGGLARACRAGRLVALIISDVVGDPLDLIASGPTVPDDSSTPAGGPGGAGKVSRPPMPASSRRVLRVSADRSDAAGRLPPPACQVTNLVIGNNATAVDAAGAEGRVAGL